MSVLKQHQAEPELSLKIGTQVFLLVNVALGRGLVNGSRGVVVGFTSDIESSMKSWTEDKSEAASSRYRQEVRDWFERNPGRQLPVVQFKSCTITVAPHAWTLDWMPRGGRVWRKQIPLKHAWAISMHKSQGMSLDKLTVELKNVFAHGQAYVALSRARSLDGLQVDKFDVHVVKAHPKVWWGCIRVCVHSPVPWIHSDFRSSLFTSKSRLMLQPVLQACFYLCPASTQVSSSI